MRSRPARTAASVVAAAVTASLVLAAPARAQSGKGANFLVGAIQFAANDLSPIGVTDGNPQAAPQFFAADAFDRFGWQPLVPLAPVADAGGRVPVDFTLAGGGIETKGDFSAYYATLGGAVAYRFTDTVAIALSIPFEYRETGSREAYIGAGTLGLPINVIQDRGPGFSWQVTPWLDAGFGASEELAQGGFIYGGGVTSGLNYRWQSFLFTLANQVCWQGGTPVGYGSRFDLEQNVHQPMLRNGGMVTYDVNTQVFLDAGVAYTNLLDGGYVDDYWTVRAGAGYRFTRDCGIRLDFVGDYGNHYSANGGRLDFFVTF